MVMCSSDSRVLCRSTLSPGAAIEDATNVITLADASVFDLAGNANSGATDSNNYAVDTVRPTVTIVVDEIGRATCRDGGETFTFSEKVTGFSNADRAGGTA